MSIILNNLSFFSVILTVFSISASPHPLILVIVYVIHELGHLFFAKLMGAEVSSLKSSLCRLNIRYDCTKISHLREAGVVAGGVVFNLIFALAFMLPLTEKSEIKSFFILCNLSLALMNLYPVNILDGGNILRCILNHLLSEEKSAKILKGISFLFAFVLWLISVYLQLVFSADVSIFFISVLLLMELCFSS